MPDADPTLLTAVRDIVSEYYDRHVDLRDHAHLYEGTGTIAVPDLRTLQPAGYGAVTRDGGRIVWTLPAVVAGGQGIAHVGDRVRYPDGTQALIANGMSDEFGHEQVAVVGSRLNSGDVIVASPIVALSQTIETSE